jgi:prepilin-type N-terminal cleavage/methylation domain-containing protein
MRPSCGLRWRRHRPGGRGGDDGFTLIELLIVIVILPIIVGGMAAALIGILRNESTTFGRDSDSADAQITAANFDRDVQSATLITTTNSANPSSGQCWPGSSVPASLNWPTAPPTGSSALLGLHWSQSITRTFDDGRVGSNQLFSQTGQADFTPFDTYYTVSDSNGLNLIPSATTTPPGTTTISSYVSPMEVLMSTAAQGSGSPDQVTLSITKTFVASYWYVPDTSASSTTYQLVRMFCQTAGGPAKFISSSILAHDLPLGQGKATITCNPNIIPTSLCTSTYFSSAPISTAGVTGIALSADEPNSEYQFNLSASPRSSNVNSAGEPGLLLTGPNSALSDPDSGDALTVNGALDFNSSSGSIAAGGSRASLDVNAIPGQAAIAENQCTPTSCGQVTSAYQGTLTCGVASCPTPSSLPSVVPIPSITPPTSPVSSGPAGSCTPVPPAPGPYTCKSGYYATAQSLSGNVTFQSGNYTFAGAVTIGTNANITFGSGQYTFDQGINVAFPATGVSISGTGVLFYFPSGPNSGSITLGSPSFSLGDSVNLSAATSGLYAGILIDQPQGNSAAMTFAGNNNNNPNTLSGLIEAPAAAVTLGSNHDIFNVGTLIAASLTLGNTNVTVTVGG